MQTNLRTNVHPARRWVNRFYFVPVKTGYIHSFIGLTWPQSRQRVLENLLWQFGQVAWVAKVSKAWPQLLHFQSSPIGGEFWHFGQWMFSRRGSLAN